MQAESGSHQVPGGDHLQLRLRLQRGNAERGSTPALTQIYDQAVRPLVDSAFQGARVTCFAYGQTGSGKTHTMNGNMAQGVRGLYTLGANDIFDYLSNVLPSSPSPSSATSRPNSPSTRSTAANSSTSSTSARNSSSARTTRTTSTSSDLKRPPSPPVKSSSTT